ncbi:trihelix transcription factor GTL2 [Impatiens glandulifera]|uniref:trihelix transcription factor GTL2 n=1 Tax=Impatiens glandulifera TaxID=253017 RepID=UPI001FB1104B|nr:trihelix transcription factor GTL2 [Impatiens glandulifera]
MFDGMPEQFHQFITSSRPPVTSQLPPSFSLLHGGVGASSGGGTSISIPPFGQPYPNSLQLQPQLLLHQLHHHHNKNDQDHEKEADVDDDHHHHHQNQMGREIVGEPRDLWTNEEVLELLRIRSSMENWFPDFTWNHVSRKLAELGFKRSPEKCKDKFEEESRHLNNNVTYTKNYRFFSELEEICHGDQNPQVQVVEEEDGNEEDTINPVPSKNDRNTDNMKEDEEEEKENENRETMDDMLKEKKRKRSSIKKKNFEMLKGFCEEIVNKMMSQQEELNNKLIEDLIKRDQEKVAKEEAWKKQETDRISKMINIRAQEHAIAKDRQTKIIEFLNKITPISPNPNNNNSNKLHDLPSASSSSTYPNQEIPNTHNNSTERFDETGKRWPREEVLALINLRCNHYRDEKEGSGSKGPLWERISKGMMELGYKRNAKRCKEKWENINKYFRKTKDVNKKRSVDSRTCPYFHQLSILFSQGALGPPENRPNSPENHVGDDHDEDDNEGEKNVGF